MCVVSEICLLVFDNPEPAFYSNETIKQLLRQSKQWHLSTENLHDVPSHDLEL